MKKINFLLKIFFAVSIFISVIEPLAAVGKNVQYDGLPVKVVLFPFREAVISSIIDMRVKKYLFKEGESFAGNDLLVIFDDSIYKQRYDKAKAAYLEAKSGLDFAKKNLVRAKDLYDKGIQGLQELEKNQFEYEVSKSKLTFHAANMKLAELDLKACSMKAPFAGRIVKKLVQEHEFIRVGQPLLKIIDDNRLLAVMHLPSNLKNKIRIGQKMQVKIDETSSAHMGTVYEIAGEIDPGSRTFEIKVLIDNNTRKLAAGMSGRLEGKQLGRIAGIVGGGKRK
jgi:RND family efflux transporter MFP subunit